MEINDATVRTAITSLANIVRAENIASESYLDLYVGEDALENIGNINNQIIYGRRGSGKTHLLKALQEKVNTSFDKNRQIAIYIDARKILPHSEANSLTSEQVAQIIFRCVIQNAIDAFSENVRAIFGRDDVISLKIDSLDQDARTRLSHILSNINLEINGTAIRRLTGC